MDLYLDIDRVILGKDDGDRIALIPNIHEIIDFVTGHFDCYWLTTHGRGPEGLQSIKRYLLPYFKGTYPAPLERFQCPPWKTWKTEAVDFSRPFIIIDDYLMAYERQVLENENCLDRWLQVDTYKDIHALTSDRIRAKQIEINEIMHLETQ
ncbi:MAG: hypothetical protein FJY83_00935 [Candidatus Aminicenantes bacterium]|nr:hypothetical protein [Candidatus Aminicenantes bacterium]